MARVHHVNEHVRLRQLLQRGLEGGHELVGELLDEAHRVGQHEGGVRRDGHEARGRVERDEELVVGRQRGARQAVQQGGLAGVGVAHEGDHGNAARPAPVAEQPPVHAHAPQLRADLADAVADDAPVRLDLLLARAARPDAAPQSLEVLPLADQTRQQIGELGQLHLELALHRARALGEDVEDESRAVDDPAPQRAAQVALLNGRERIVGDHQVGASALLGDPPDDVGAGRFGQPLQLIQGLLDLVAPLGG